MIDVYFNIARDTDPGNDFHDWDMVFVEKNHYDTTKDIDDDDYPGLDQILDIILEHTDYVEHNLVNLAFGYGSMFDNEDDWDKVKISKTKLEKIDNELESKIISDYAKLGLNMIRNKSIKVPNC